MVGLAVLPLPARETVVRFLPPADVLLALPFVSEVTLAALQELPLPLGVCDTDTVEAAERQAQARRRAWDLGTLDLSLSEGGGGLVTGGPIGATHAQSLVQL